MNHIFVYAIVVLLVVIAAVIHFTLLIIKTDRDGDLTYHQVIIPAVIAYGIGTIALFVWGLLWIVVRRLPRGFGFLAMAVLTGGSLWTQILLARKFDLELDISYLEALLPVTIAIVLSGLLFVIGIASAYVVHTSQQRPFKSRNK